MNFKKTLSAILAGVMLIGSAVSVSAGNVYTKEDFVKPVTTVYPNGGLYSPYPFYNGYFYNPIYDGYYAGIYNGVNLEAYWNPITGKYNNCTCGYCLGTITPSGYYWVNGVLCNANDYYIKYAPHTIKVETTEVKTEPGDVSEQTGITYNESKIPTGAIKRKPAASASTEGNVVITESGNVTVKNPSILGGFNATITIPGKYYPCNKVNIEEFFAKNTQSLYLRKGDVQTFDDGFKMISSDSKIVRVITDKDGQHLQAVGSGYAYVYLYTGGGVPFLRLYVNVSNQVYNQSQGYIDIEVANWKLDKAGDSTDVVVKADKKYDDIKLEVVTGNGYIGKDGKLYANGNGAILLRAYSAKLTNIQGYAIVYVGEYVNALYNGYWTSGNGCIIGNYWNPYLWGYDGYKIVGWVLTSTGAYVPVIDKDATVVKPGTIVKPGTVIKPGTAVKPGITIKPENGSNTTIIVINDLYDLLYGHCYGDVSTLYRLLWLNYKANKPVQSFESLYAKAMQEILDEIAANYDKQIH